MTGPLKTGKPLPRITRIDTDCAAIRTDLARALSLDDTADIEAALAEATRTAFEQESDGPFRAYHAAVFESGLSPAQRRLLLDSAVDQLGLPLPTGEYQPLQ